MKEGSGAAQGSPWVPLTPTKLIPATTKQRKSHLHPSFPAKNLHRASNVFRSGSLDFMVPTTAHNKADSSNGRPATFGSIGSINPTQEIGNHGETQTSSNLDSTGSNRTSRDTDNWVQKLGGLDRVPFTTQLALQLGATQQTLASTVTGQTSESFAVSQSQIGSSLQQDDTESYSHRHPNLLPCETPQYGRPHEDKDNQAGVITYPGNDDKEHLHSEEQTEPIISTVLEKQETKKRRNTSIDMNNKPRKKPRRKTHRPKVVVEGKPKRTQKMTTPKTQTPKKTFSKKTSSEKRKYVRKKSLKASPTELENVTWLATNPVSRHVPKSCKRALNFNLENYPRGASTLLTDELGSNDISSSKCGLSLNSESQDRDLTFETSHMSSVDLDAQSGKRNFTVLLCPNQKRDNNGCTENLQSQDEKPGKSPDPAQTVCDQSMGSVAELQPNIPHLISKMYDYKYTRRRHSASSKHGAECSLEDCCRIISRNDPCSMNQTGHHYNSLEKYQKILCTGPNFPMECKKKRSWRRQSAAKSWSSNHIGIAESSILVHKRLTKRLKGTESQARIARGSPQLFNCVLSLRHLISNVWKKRSKRYTRKRDIASLIAVPNCNELPTLKQALPGERLVIENLSGHDKDALVVDICHSVLKALRRRSRRSTTRRDTASLTAIPYCNQLSATRIKQAVPGERQGIEIIDGHEASEDVLVVANLEQRIGKRMTETVPSLVNPLSRNGIDEEFLHNGMTADAVSGGAAATLQMKSIDTIIQKMKCLNISERGNQIVVHNQNGHSLESGHRILVPLHHPKKKEIPKVDLDPETMRVWRELMENDGTEDIEEERDDEKQKWWEKERKMYRERVDSFIGRMHLAQGNRRFSLWKGSVVDSVVGVFLTQNATDHLSSSAFMSLAARFPPTSHEACNEDEEFINSQESTESDTKAVEYLKDEQLVGSANEQDMSHESEENKLWNLIIEAGRASSVEVEDSITVMDVHLPETSAGSAVKLYEFELCSAHNLMEDTETGSKMPYKADVSTAFLKPLQSEETTFSQQSHNCKDELLSDGSILKEQLHSSSKNSKQMKAKTPRQKKPKVVQKKENIIDWDSLRKSYSHSTQRKSTDTMDSVNWEAVRNAPVSELAKIIQDRGQNNVLAGRIQDFLNRLVREHGSIDLEWLRDVPPDKSKDYLLSFPGLGLKSVECVRLLTLHHLAFPVDTNVGRIAVRLGWVPLQPLPEQLQIHLLNSYPIMDSIQKYLWPRLCMIDQRTLYELHYQMITFGKVFCMKIKPNCKACPLRGECKHFASAFASAKLALPESKESSIANSIVPSASTKTGPVSAAPPSISLLEERPYFSSGLHTRICEPIIEEPASPEPECPDITERDIEDYFSEDSDEISLIKLNIQEFTANPQNYMDKNNMTVHEGDASKALVALTSQGASILWPKLKSISRLRTEHQVYELPDSHPLLTGQEKREPDDPSPYLLAIWTPGETAESSKISKKICDCKESTESCNEKACLSCNYIKDQNCLTVYGTLLIPCRTAMRGSFPLNGTYFQVNEVFADDESSQVPINVPRAWIWNMPRRTVYFGTSTTSILRGLLAEEIQRCFWRGFVCIRGFNQQTREPKRLATRFHHIISKKVKPSTEADDK